MSAEENVAVVRRFFDDVLNGRNLAAAADLIAAGYVYHDPPSMGGGGTGLDAIKEEIAMYHRAFPDVRWIIREILAAENNSVVVRWTAEGTHQDELNGIPATGRFVSVEALIVFRLRNGRIVESWEIWDALAVMQQLGLVSSPADAADPAALARTIYACFNEDRLDEALAYATDDVEITLMPFGQSYTGREGFRAFMQDFKTAFPDCTVYLTRQVATEDGVVNEFRARGTHRGPLASPAGAIPPTGRSIDYPVCEVWEIREGKLARLRNYFDAASLMRQLGLLPEEEAA